MLKCSVSEPQMIALDSFIYFRLGSEADVASYKCTRLGSNIHFSFSTWNAFRIDDRDSFFMLCFDLLEFSLLSQLFAGAIPLDGMCERSDVMSWKQLIFNRVAYQEARWFKVLIFTFSSLACSHASEMYELPQIILKCTRYVFRCDKHFILCSGIFSLLALLSL